MIAVGQKLWFVPREMRSPLAPGYWTVESVGRRWIYFQDKRYRADKDTLIVDGGDYNWERLARSEIAMAQSDGSLALYEQQGITLVDYSTAEDEFVSTICRELAAAGPYTIDKCPVPVRDSHPGCRCALVPAA